MLPEPDAVGASLYAALEKTGNRPVRAMQRISAANLGEADAKLLAIPAGSASLNIERISYLATGKVIEFTRSIYRGDTYDFVAELRLTGPAEQRSHQMAETHMRREIAEIPEATARLLDQAGSALAAAGAEIRALDPRFLTTVARGSSDHAAAFLKYAIELTAGVPVASLGPSIASIYGARLKLAQSASIAISQSGKSPDIVAMAKSARDGGALTIAITNTAGSPLAAGSDHAIDIRSGTEKSVAATKTFVASAVAGLAILGEWTGDKALLAALGELPGHFAKAIDCDWMDIAGALPQTQFAVHPRARAIGGDRQRGGAEVQGDLRHACRSLLARPK